MYKDESGEYRLLGSIIDKPDSVLAYTQELFTDNRVRIFNAMRNAYLSSGDISTEGVERFYGSMLPPELEMARGVRPAALIEHLSELATKRQLARLSDSLSRIITSPTLDRGEINRLLQLQPLVTREDSSLTPGITAFTAEFVRKRDDQYRFVRTGLPFLDHMLGGEWPRQALTVVLGQAGGGKTALVVNSMLRMAQQGIASLFISLEMPRSKIISRMVANLAEVDGMALRRGKITEEEQARVDAALIQIQELEGFMYIIDSPGQTVEDIVYQIRIHKEAHDIQAFFVDYLQIVDRPKAENDVEALAYVTQQLRNTAVLLDIAAIALSQKNGQEGLQSVWGSRRIVQIADSIFEIQIDTESTQDTSRTCRLNFHKNRDGPVGEAHCVYKPRYLQFV